MSTPIDSFMYWDVYDKLPEGWVIDKAGSAAAPGRNMVFITNGKSPLKGQKRALLLLDQMPVKKAETAVKTQEALKKEPIPEQVPEVAQSAAAFPAKKVNDLARLRFKHQLLKDIMCDLMICEIEGWDKKEYINSLKKLLNSIDTSKKPTKTDQLSIF